MSKKDYNNGFKDGDELGKLGKPTLRRNSGLHPLISHSITFDSVTLERTNDFVTTYSVTPSDSNIFSSGYSSVNQLDPKIDVKSKRTKKESIESLSTLVVAAPAEKENTQKYIYSNFSQFKN